MLREQWKEATLEFRVARAVVRRAAAIFKKSRHTHRADAFQDNSFSVSEVNASISSLKALDRCCLRFTTERSSLSQSNFACELGQSVRAVNESTAALADIDNELATAFQIEASPVMAKAYDMMLYMKRKGLTKFALPFEEMNDATLDRQKAIEEGIYWPRLDRSELQENEASAERLRRFADFAEDRSPV
jgi:DNA-binding transcriptional regulator YiaG